MSRQMELRAKNVEIRLIENGRDGLMGWVSLVIDPGIRLNNIAIRRGHDGGVYLTYPAKRNPHGSRHYYFNPISTEAARAVQEAVQARLTALAGTQSARNRADA